MLWGFKIKTTRTTGALPQAALVSTPPAARRRQGAVLLEVILALVLFVGAAAVVMAGMNASLESVERQRLTAHAANLAVTVISELQMGLRSASLTGPEDFAAPFINWTWELQVTSLGAEPGETSSLATVEVIIRHKPSGLVHRLAQVIRLGPSQGGGKEPPESAAL
jgi:hypothetical protein